MMAYLNKKRGQSTLEYAVLIIVIIAALIAIQIYIRRGVQGKLKSSADDIGDQFSPGNTNMIVAEKRSTKERQLFGINPTTGNYQQGVSTTQMIEAEVTNRASKAVILNIKAEDWGT
jgi:uncharacterized protein (UPF0333 family)